MTILPLFSNIYFLTSSCVCPVACTIFPKAKEGLHFFLISFKSLCMYSDAHLHPADYIDSCISSDDTGTVSELFAQSISLCCSAHDHTEYERHRSLLQLSESRRVLFSFGIHPQNPVTDEAEFLYRLLETRQIQAIGECGFDLFNDDYKQLLPMQQTVWDMQLRWAQEFQLPTVIHCRKALPLIFDSVARLKKLPAVIFHGWGGSPQEAAAFLKKGVNAYFSLGKAVLRGQKSVCAMAASFDSSRLLTETDAPYMRLKSEPYSHPRDIIAVTAQCAHLRYTGDDTAKHPRVQSLKRIGIIKQYESCTTALEEIDIDEAAVEAFSDIIVRNFNCAFGLSN